MVVAAGQSFAVSGWLGLLLGVLGVAGLTAFVLAYLRASVSKATIENYRDAVASQDARINSLEADASEAKEHRQRCEAELEAQKTVNAVLSNTVTSAPAIKELRDTIEARFGDLIEGQDHMAEAIGGLVHDMRTRMDLNDFDRRSNG